MKNLGVVIFLCLLNAGCVSHGVKNAVAFGNPLNLKQLEGCYENKGDGGKGGARYLSYYIFPGARPDGDEIQYINVASVDEKTLKISAESNKRIMNEIIFVNGKDFHFVDGKIKISSELGATAPIKPGSVFLGVVQESKYLGIDANGDGKLQESFAMAGTAFLFIPVAGASNGSFRFKKSINSCKNS